MSRTRLACSLLLAGLFATACTSEQPPAPTVVVDRGAVSQVVSASGSLVSITQQNLGFADGGQVAELLVKVGDTVAAGQPLARLDDAAARSQIAKAQAGLDQQNATLGKVSGANTVASAQAALDSARSVLDATRSQVDATNAADESAVRRARVQLDFDRSQLERAKKQLAAAKAACASPTTPTTTAPPALLAMGGTEGSADTADPAAACQQQVATAQQAVQTAKGTVIASETALDSAEGKRSVDAASGRVSIANAEQAVSSAEQQRAGAANDAPADVAVQDAVVADARNTLADAQRALDNTVLRAPVAGTVSAINGAVGDFLSAAGGASALAPGSDARIPEAVGTATAGGAAASPAASAFITLNDLQTYQLVVPFEESDAARVTANQPVDVSVDAVPDLTLPGTVVAVAPTADQISGVVSYYATVVLNQTDPALKDGQTAQADVRTDTRENVLRVPASAVRQEGGKSVVSVPGPDGTPVTREFTPGLVGDRYTEVRSGLDEGQQVLLPQATVGATPQGARGGG
ncbi:efflux RND transporter periplasmic adaptor subunit [Pseudonocardia sp. WMMC193]|uniref:efflux RND transporter periplasmic adaptor subunit n=1 Tax=Pseudonocardia sp. WMMC193 TaxID=2911965 RepID=UPI001F3A5053|nr:HlyD family efflux transporter periplasmic adaptor subunit [Pseudonocardia sp. WMMC193]MCF7550237.1 HlyD family efflux transporter periplasmic adaptor subunit [Pseudonocardia sp. WMMC193]